MRRRTPPKKKAEPHDQCRAWYSDRDLFGRVWRTQCLLTAGHACEEHMGKDPNGTIIRFTGDRGEWEVR